MPARKWSSEAKRRMEGLEEMEGILGEVNELVAVRTSITTMISKKMGLMEIKAKALGFSLPSLASKAIDQMKGASKEER